MEPFRFVILTDTHVRSGDEIDTPYRSDQTANSRHADTVKKIGRLNPDFVIHLGDVVHPIPTIQGHDIAVKTAKAHYATLDCPVYVAPGNHDVGDKPNAWVPAPEVDNGHRDNFETYWGPCYRVIDHHGCRFILLNSSLLSTGLAAEADQENRLERDLRLGRHSGNRLFVCMHYPLFIDRPDEGEHYDNIALPARSRLLSLFLSYGVEAVFSGHAHAFFYNRYEQTDHYVAPSATFVRPDYSELFQIPPGPEREYGRYDTDKLGFIEVSVTAENHSVRLIRTTGKLRDEPLATEPQQSRLYSPTPSAPTSGVTLRHSWDYAYELPFDNLDEFNRKTARNDYWLAALWELGTRRIRLPIGDLTDVGRRRRMAALIHRGFCFTVFSAGLPSAQVAEILSRHHRLMEAWEIIVPEVQLDEAFKTIASLKTEIPLRTYLSKIAGTSEQDFRSGGYFNHFASHGYRFEDLPQLTNYFTGRPGAGEIDGVVFSVRQSADLPAMVGRAARLLAPYGIKPIINIEFPRVDEGVICDGDTEVASLAAESVVTAHAVPNAVVFWDTFVDHDRGYYPRHGLLDRRYNPRMGFYVASRLQAELRGMAPVLSVRSISTPEKDRAIILNGKDRCMILVMPQAPHETTVLNVADLSNVLPETGGRVTSIDLVTGERGKVLVKPDGANHTLTLTYPAPPVTAPFLLKP